MAWSLVAVALACGAGLLVWAAARHRLLRPIGEAAPGVSISSLETGRFRLVGRIVPLTTTQSSIDESPCVFIERAVYRTFGSELIPVLRQVDHFIRAHPFYLDDGTGRVLVDPGGAVVDAATLVEDEGLLAERRLRAGEEVELVADFEPRPDEGDGGGPYRGAALGWQAVSDGATPPRIGHAAPQSGFGVSDEITAFLRGAGAVLVVLGVVLAVTVALL